MSMHIFRTTILEHILSIPMRLIVRNATKYKTSTVLELVEADGANLFGHEQIWEHRFE